MLRKKHPNPSIEKAVKYADLKDGFMWNPGRVPTLGANYSVLIMINNAVAASIAKIRFGQLPKIRKITLRKLSNGLINVST